MENKTAIILFNLGGPDSLDNVKPFLFNLFNDPAIISLPSPFRYLVAKLISSKRESVAQKIYEEIGGRSPILEETKAQSESLEKVLNAQKNGSIYKTFICMRYSNPRVEDVINQVIEYDPDEIILLPLYPQFSTTTTGSSLKEWKLWAQKKSLNKQTKEICCYPTQGSFVRSHAAKIRDYYNKAGNNGVPRILFSAHGLPKKIIEKGDPYQWQVEQTSQNIVDLLNIENLDWKVCYQSKVGPLEWIGPSTEDEIIAAAEDGGISLVIVPIAFVSEHSETLVELDIEYKKLAEDNGLRDYFRVPSLSVDELFINTLKEVCLNEKSEKICPEEFGKCGNNSAIIAK